MSLRLTPESPVARFGRNRAQDRTSFPVTRVLAGGYPGRFTVTSPATVGPHPALSPLEERMDRVVVAP